MRTDVLDVGGGVMRTVVPPVVRVDRSNADITMVDDGPEVGHVVGLHLHDVADAETRRSGPSTVLPALNSGCVGHLDDAGTHLLTETTCVRIEHCDSRATGAVLQSIRSAADTTIEARVVAAAAALRSPQLLGASHIRPPALGAHLNVWTMLTGRALLDHERFGLDLSTIPPLRDRECNSRSSWLPVSGPEQPFQVQLMETAAEDADGRVVAYHVGLTWYVPTEIRPENRIEFADELDSVGHPAMLIHLALSDRDRESVERGRVDQARVGHALGTLDADRDTAVLPAGSSLHMTGSARMGAAGDGTIVCAPDRLVWDTYNVLVAGNGVVSMAFAANTTLAGSVTAVRAARRAALVLEGVAA